MWRKNMRSHQSPTYRKKYRCPIFDVANFSICTNEENREKRYHSISAYGDKVQDVKDYKRGNFVKVFSQLRYSTGRNGKEYTNVKLHTTHLFKAKTQMKDQNKESTLGQLAKYKEKVAQDKSKPQEKAETKKNDREM